MANRDEGEKNGREDVPLLVNAGAERLPQQAAPPRNQKISKCCCCTILVVGLLALIAVSIFLAAGSYIYADNLSKEPGVSTVNSLVGTYERFGHASCPDVAGTSPTVYSGYVLGFGESSTAFHCFPTKHVKYYNDSISAKVASSSSRFAIVKRAKRAVYGRDDLAYQYIAKCALCTVSGRTKVQMFPATYECPDSWTLEYQGYLMTDSYGTTFVCIDIELEAYKIGSGSISESSTPILHHVVAANLKLSEEGEYNKWKVLSCAVCSK